jgi:hypothetical protein
MIIDKEIVKHLSNVLKMAKVYRDGKDRLDPSYNNFMWFQNADESIKVIESLVNKISPKNSK